MDPQLETHLAKIAQQLDYVPAEWRADCVAQMRSDLMEQLQEYERVGYSAEEARELVFRDAAAPGDFEFSYRLKTALPDNCEFEDFLCFSIAIGGWVVEMLFTQLLMLGTHVGVAITPVVLGITTTIVPLLVGWTFGLRLVGRTFGLRLLKSAALNRWCTNRWMIVVFALALLQAPHSVIISQWMAGWAFNDNLLHHHLCSRPSILDAPIALWSIGALSWSAAVMLLSMLASYIWWNFQRRTQVRDTEGSSGLVASTDAARDL